MSRPLLEQTVLRDRCNKHRHMLSGAQRWALKKLYLAGEAGLDRDELSRNTVAQSTLDILERIELVEWVDHRCRLTEAGYAMFVDKYAVRV